MPAATAGTAADRSPSGDQVAGSAAAQKARTHTGWTEELQKHSPASVEWFIKDAEVLAKSVVERECMRDFDQAELSLALLADKIAYLENLHKAQARQNISVLDTSEDHATYSSAGGGRIATEGQREARGTSRTSSSSTSTAANNSSGSNSVATSGTR